MNNTEVYNKWCEYQKANNKLEPGYPVEAYTQETIDSWKRILIEVWAEREMYRMNIENQNIPDYSNRGQYSGD